MAKGLYGRLRKDGRVYKIFSIGWCCIFFKAWCLLHGDWIARRIEQVSDDLRKLNEGTGERCCSTWVEHQQGILASWVSSDR